ncbi:MAG: carboxypeptidase regulatory-like domain-containing protein, partial [Vicinamibacterales bacterium]
VFNISGTVAETAPTTDRFLDGVTLSAGDKSIATDGAGRFTLSGFAAGSYGIRASKGGYEDQVITVTLPEDATKTIQFNLQPNFDFVTRERSGTIGQDNNPCHGGSLPCARYDFPAHYSEDVTATLLWSSSDAEFRLEMRCNGESVADQTQTEGGEVFRNGETYLSLELESQSDKGKICEVRVLHVSGPEQKYVLVVTHSN